MKKLFLSPLALILLFGLFGAACSSGNNPTTSPAANYQAPSTTQSLATASIAPATTVPAITTQPPTSIAASFTLTLAAAGTGTVSPSAGGHSYTQGAVVSTSATAGSGWQFMGWMGTVTDAKAAATTVTVNANQTITANFAQMTTPPTTTPPDTTAPICDGG